MNIREENELICKKLLGWAPCKHPECVGWFHHDGKPCLCGPGQEPHKRTKDFPTFTTWAEAGLILDALDACEPEVILRKFRVNDVNWTARTRKSEGFGNTGPLAIRAAALEYIKATRSWCCEKGEALGVEVCPECLQSFGCLPE